jgi:hypothetical protein
VLEHLNNELGRQLRKQRRLALEGQLNFGGGGSERGEESTDFIRECYSFRSLLAAEMARSSGALAGGGA